MASVSNDNFGLVIAYVIPGAGFLYDVRNKVATVNSWFSEGGSDKGTF